MAGRLPAKLLLATAHGEIGNEEDVIIVRRGSLGVQCYTTMNNEATLALLDVIGEAMYEAKMLGKAHG